MKKIATMALCLALAACGGGGGGSSTPAPTTNNALSVSIDRSELRFTADEGKGFVPQAVLGSANGAYGGTVYVGALDLGTAIDHVTTEIIGSQVKFTVYPKSNLPAGQYRGKVQLFACPDAKCSIQFSGSPANVDYTVTVNKGLTISPTGVVQFEVLAGATATREISVQLPPDLGSFIVTTPGWLRALNVTPTGFTLQTIAQPPGNWSGTVNVSAGPSRSTDIPVIYSVRADSTTITQIKPDVSSLMFEATASQVAAPRVVNVVLPSWANELSAEAVQGNNGTWLTAVVSANRQVTVTANAATLSAGTYTGKVVLRAGTSGAPGTVAEIPVSLTVGAPSWQLSGKLGFSVGGETTASQLSSDINISSPGLPGQTWSASTTSSWLKLLTTGGAIGTAPLKVAVDQAQLATLENYVVSAAEVTLSSAGGKLPPTKLTFTVDKRIPEVSFISPAVRLPGEGGQLIVRGRGFDSVGDLQAALTISGATAQSIERVNDTELLLQVAATSGEASFSVKNALGLTPNTVKLNVVPARSYAYSAIATAGNKGAIAYDPVRQAIYTTNKTLGTVMRFGFNNGAWDISAGNLAGVESLQMAPDRSSVVATTTTGKVTLFNPDNLTLQASYTNVGGTIGGYALNSLATLAMLNDGKAVFQGSVNGGSGYAYFDLVTRKFGSYAMPPSAYYSSSPPAFNASGNGSRLLIGYPSNSASNALYYADAADGVVKLNGGGVTYWHEGAQSFNGDRMTLASYQVRDRDFNLMGNLIFPQGYYGRTPLFAPDGMRLYVMAYPSTSGLPRVFVFDTSKKSLTSANMPLLGYFELPDYPTCNDNSYECNTRAVGTITPDGKTLFIAGDKRLLVVPVPGVLNVAMAAPAIERGKAGSSAVPAQMAPLHLKR